MSECLSVLCQAVLIPSSSGRSGTTVAVLEGGAAAIKSWRWRTTVGLPVRNKQRSRKRLHANVRVCMRTCASACE
eukprot:4757562-Pleurochrysis_carterae.AAC.1